MTHPHPTGGEETPWLSDGILDVLEPLRGRLPAGTYGRYYTANHNALVDQRTTTINPPWEMVGHTDLAVAWMATRMSQRDRVSPIKNRSIWVRANTMDGVENGPGYFKTRF